ncbi:MAG: IS630 family transposase [Candidatus Cloacimonadaceae bacterium]|nr:IS630 family transposase [Candidatus Cloacimonadaceae bacterium]MDP3113669.1 IS630 family transposase [Candidatus Cloacimonadaceae bacterium]
MDPRRKRLPLVVDATVKAELEKIANRRTQKHASVFRARILLSYIDGRRISDIARDMNTTRPLVERCIDKAFNYGIMDALNDLPRSGRKPLITDDAKAWVINLACTAPKELGYAAEVWTFSMLVKHILQHAEANGHSCLMKMGKGGLTRILDQANLHPHKVSYYLEKRDPEFAIKMANVLCVYKEVEMINAEPDVERKQTTISFDEKPGIQAIKNIAAQLSPVPGVYPNIGRDYEYKRLGTVSLLAGIDLHTGHVYSVIRDRHRSLEFIEFLSLIDSSYPPDWSIKLILDNHSSHLSKETQKFLQTKPSRFEFVFTPKHGSWLNMIEMFFSKISRSFLRHIRVGSKQELVERIYQGLDEINKTPVVFRWKYKMNEVQL